ncbi:MAG: type II toxin-antitoxin system VapC family toxin [Planctomycetes bacterium]|nr:type II toxin-antitoxin system VapC family toxin [Planctomycetota bacterium]
MVLVDTNVLSELPRPRPNVHALRWLEVQERVAISVISVEELSFGVARSPHRKRLIPWLETLLAGASSILDVTPAVAKASGELRAAREAAGRRVAQADMLIAATALVHGLGLATRHLRDFEGCGVTLINPFSPLGR